MPDGLGYGVRMELGVLSEDFCCFVGPTRLKLSLGGILCALLLDLRLELPPGLALAQNI